MKTALLKPDPQNSLFICKVYFDRPNQHDPSKNQQKRFYSFDYPNERQRPPRLEELGEEAKLLAYNGYRKMVDWVAKAKKDHYFKMAYIYTNCHRNENGLPKQLRLFLPYTKEACKPIDTELCKPHWKESVFRMEVYYQKEEGYQCQTLYSQDFAHERRQLLSSPKPTPEMQAMHGFRYLRDKAVACRKHPQFRLLVLYANQLGENGLEILRKE